MLAEGPGGVTWLGAHWRRGPGRLTWLVACWWKGDLARATLAVGAQEELPGWGTGEVT